MLSTASNDLLEYALIIIFYLSYIVYLYVMIYVYDVSMYMILIFYKFVPQF